MAGPPCNTWSRARAAPGGPEVVHSVASPWGLPDLAGPVAEQAGGYDHMALLASMVESGTVQGISLMQ